MPIAVATCRSQSSRRVRGWRRPNTQSDCLCRCQRRWSDLAPGTDRLPSRKTGSTNSSQINSAVNSLDWSSGNKSTAAAQFATTARTKNWTLTDIATATGYNFADIVSLFAGQNVALGVGAGAMASSYAGMSKTSGINAAVSAFDWSEASKPSSSLAICDHCQKPGLDAVRYFFGHGLLAARHSKVSRPKIFSMGTTASISAASASSSLVAGPSSFTQRWGR